MADINFDCPHCGQNLNGPEEVVGETIECPVCKKSFQIPGGIIEVPKSQLAPPSRPSAPASPAQSRSATDADKGKTVRIVLPPEFLTEPEKHMFKIKRIQR
jgi:hypothetical protein